MDRRVTQSGGRTALVTDFEFESPAIRSIDRKGKGQMTEKHVDDPESSVVAEGRSGKLWCAQSHVGWGEHPETELPAIEVVAGCQRPGEHQALAVRAGSVQDESLVLGEKTVGSMGQEPAQDGGLGTGLGSCQKEGGQPERTEEKKG